MGKVQFKKQNKKQPTQPDQSREHSNELAHWIIPCVNKIRIHYYWINWQEEK